jgi:tetratricopeptide (TPR) repeat protein
MAISVKSGPMTDADELRELLSRSEERVVRPESRQGVLELFAWLDTMAGLWPGLRAGGADLRAEWTRWEGVQSQVRQRGSRLLAAAGGARSLAEARRQAQPDESHWWWWLDEIVARDRRRRTFRVTGILAALVALILLGVAAFNALFPVDPQVKEAYRLRTSAETALADEDRAQALPYLAQAVQVTPDDASLQILYGTVAYSLEDETTAQAAWDRGRSLMDDEASFLVERGRTFVQVNLPERAIADEEAALRLDPQSAAAYFVLGLAYELAGNRSQALDAYSQASELASDTDPQLTVLARTRMATLLQQLDTGAVPEATP